MVTFSTTQRQTAQHFDDATGNEMKGWYYILALNHGCI